MFCPGLVDHKKQNRSETKKSFDQRDLTSENALSKKTFIFIDRFQFYNKAIIRSDFEVGPRNLCMTK